MRVVVGAGHPLGEPPLALGVGGVLVDELDDEDATGEAESGLDRVGEATLGAGVVALRDEPVDDDVDRVLDLLLQRGRLGQGDDLAVDPGPGEPLGLELGEQVDVLPLAGPDHRREDLEPGPLGQGEETVDDLLGALPGDRLTARRTVRPPGPGEQEPQVVVDLGDGADGRAGVAVGRLLVDGDGRREALDEVDVRLVHLAEELAGVRRQRLDVAALTLGEDRVEREGGLPRPGQPGEHDERVPGQVDRDVPEVVLARPVDDEAVMSEGRHRSGVARGRGHTGHESHARRQHRQVGSVVRAARRSGDVRDPRLASAG